VQVDTDDDVAPLRVVADEGAVADPRRIGLAEHAPLRDMMLALHSQHAQHLRHQAFRRTLEVHLRAAAADLAAGVEAGPAHVFRRGRNEWRRAAQGRHVEILGVGVRHESKQTKNNKTTAHDGLFDSRRYSLRHHRHHD
jgi:hypothetical protein